MFLQLILLMFTNQLLGISGETLNILLADGTLPLPLSHATTVYDGKDSVYIVGGMSDGAESGNVLKYSISADRVEIIGNRVRMQASSGVLANDEKLIQFGGRNWSNVVDNKIWTAKTNDPSNWSHVGNIPIPLQMTASVWDGDESTYIIGGQGGGLSDAIFKYSHTTHEVYIVGRLPSGRYWPSAVWDDNARQVYIFSGWNSGSLGEILKFVPVTGQVTKLRDHSDFAYMSCAVWTGKYAYIIGGYLTVFRILRFNPVTNSVTYITVNNGPTQELYALGCAYVKNLNRIYIFGGSTRDSGNKREILYINLTV